MRITGGQLGGRLLRAVGTMRPTQDKVRQAVFSALGEAVVEARVLDLFAGTGSLGLEAASRGAASVVWVESNPRAAAQLQKAVQELCPEAGRVVKAEATAFLGRAGGGASFDLVFADPPYAKGLQEKTLPLLMAGSIVAPRGVIVFEMASEEAPVDSPGWARIWDRTYGDSRVCMWQREAQE